MDNPLILKLDTSARTAMELSVEFTAPVRIDAEARYGEIIAPCNLQWKSLFSIKSIEGDYDATL